MNTIERQEYLLKEATAKNFVSIPNSADFLGVSVETIRRDINRLCEKRLLKKVHGGAVPVKLSFRKDPQYTQRIKQNQQVKTAIAHEAIKLIRDGDTITFGGGATTVILAEQIHSVHNVTFVVNSLHIANTLANKLASGEITGRLIFIGGEIDYNTRHAIDLYALESMEKFHFDIAFVSCSALSASAVSNDSLSSIYMKRLLQRANTAVLLVDSDKLGVYSTHEFAKPTDFDWIITDDQKPFPKDLMNLLQDSDTRLKIVKSN